MRHSSIKRYDAIFAEFRVLEISLSGWIYSGKVGIIVCPPDRRNKGQVQLMCHINHTRKKYNADQKTE